MDWRSTSGGGGWERPAAVASRCSSPFICSGRGNRRPPGGGVRRFFGRMGDEEGGRRPAAPAGQNHGLLRGSAPRGGVIKVF